MRIAAAHPGIAAAVGHVAVAVPGVAIPSAMVAGVLALAELVGP
jgi:hypothetical protein